MVYNYRLFVEYDGSRFHGWQRQNYQSKERCRTVQGEIERAVSKISSARVTLIGASRTDAGVHARAQVAHFVSRKAFELSGFANTLNSMLPGGIVIQSIEKARKNFHARFDARAKEYEYVILNSPRKSAFEERAWWIPQKLSIARMRKAARLFVGEKDFGACGKKSDSRARDICAISSISIRVHNNRVAIRFRGNRFLWKMVRIIVSILAACGTGKAGIREIRAFLNQEIDMPFLRKPAPAQGLFLHKVIY